MNAYINRSVWMALTLGSLVNITGCKPNSDAQFGPRPSQPQMVSATPETRLPAAIADLPAVVQQRIRQVQAGASSTARLAGVQTIAGNWEMVAASSYPAFEDIPGWTIYAPYVDANGWFNDWAYGMTLDPKPSLKMQLNPGQPFSSQGIGWFSWIQGTIGRNTPFGFWRFDNFGSFGRITLGNSGSPTAEILTIQVNNSILLTVSSTPWTEYVNGVQGVTRVHTDLRTWRRY